jgi:internalin A
MKRISVLSILLLLHLAFLAPCRADESRDAALAAVTRLGGRVEVNVDSIAKPIIAIQLQETKTEDGDLAKLQSFRNLERLNLSKTRVTNAGLPHVARFTRLRTLKLSNLSDVTDDGLVHLQALKQLERIDLQGTGVNGAGFVHLAVLPNLRAIYLSTDRITDESMKHLEKITTLEELLLAYTKVTDAGIARVQALSDLRSLHVRSGLITDVGLMSLAKVPHLELLQVPSTPGITAMGVAQFKQAARHVKVVYGERPDK